MLTSIASYLSSNWLEAAGFLTTLIGIWLTTRRGPRLRCLVPDRVLSRPFAF